MICIKSRHHLPAELHGKISAFGAGKADGTSHHGLHAMHLPSDKC